MHKRELVAHYAQTIGNVAVAVGVLCAVVQLRQASHIESVRLAVEAISPARSSDFLGSYGKLIAAYSRDPDMLETETLDDDLLFVMNVYDNISILYLHGLADETVIEARVFQGMQALTPVLRAKKWPHDSRLAFDAALARMISHGVNEQPRNIQ